MWEVANQTKNLKAIFIETSFDNALQHIADVSFHLTPHTLSEELRKLEKKVPIYLHHLKPPCIAKIQEEVEALANPDIGYLEQDGIYEF